MKVIMSIYYIININIYVKSIIYNCTKRIKQYRENEYIYNNNL